MTELRHPVIRDDSLETTIRFSQGLASSAGAACNFVASIANLFLSHWVKISDNGRGVYLADRYYKKGVTRWLELNHFIVAYCVILFLPI